MHELMKCVERKIEYNLFEFSETINVTTLHQLKWGAHIQVAEVDVDCTEFAVGFKKNPIPSEFVSDPTRVSFACR